MRKSLFILATLSVACGSTNATAPQEESSGRASAPTTTVDAGAPTLQKINHFVVIVLENWSFDSLYAEFEGANGLTNALTAPPQIDPTTGQPYATLPQTETHVPAGLANTPFALDPYLSVGEDTSIDLTTNFFSEKEQIDNGKMDLFVANSAAKGLTMGYFHTADLPIAAEARQYVLCDHFFHGVYGGSFQNHRVWFPFEHSSSFQRDDAQS
jgi:phospholipase C